MNKFYGFALTVVLAFSVVLCGCNSATYTANNSSNNNSTSSSVSTNSDGKELDADELDNIVRRAVDFKVAWFKDYDKIKRHEYEITDYDYLGDGHYKVYGKMRCYDKYDDLFNPEGGTALEGKFIVDFDNEWANVKDITVDY